MKLSIAIFCTFISFAALGETFVPSGRAKIFKGPEGEIITMIPLSENTKMLVDAKNTYGIAEGKTWVYNYKEVSDMVTFPNPKAKDENDHSAIVILEKISANGTPGPWQYEDRLEGGQRVRRYTLTYVGDVTKKEEIQNLLRRARPFQFEGTR